MSKWPSSSSCSTLNSVIQCLKLYRIAISAICFKNIFLCDSKKEFLEMSMFPKCLFIRFLGTTTFLNDIGIDSILILRKIFSQECSFKLSIIIFVQLCLLLSFSFMVSGWITRVVIFVVCVTCLHTPLIVCRTTCKSLYIDSYIGRAEVPHNVQAITKPLECKWLMDCLLDKGHLTLRKMELAQLNGSPRGYPNLDCGGLATPYN